MSELSERIRRELAAAGVISFARFMELALYYPGLGYYERTAKHIGCHGDYFTSVSVGPVFGELLASQFADWMEELTGKSEIPGAAGGNATARPRGETFQIAEAGAHDGRLAADILNWFAQWRPAGLAHIEYWLIEPSPQRRQWQAQTLREHAARVRWFESWDALPSSGVRGVIFSNELLDAFPVHRLGWDAKARQWFEWGVKLADGQFAFCRMPIASETSRAVPKVPAGLLDVLPNEFNTEICPAAAEWWTGAATALRTGRLLTIDYGLTTEEFFTPQRAQGTLRALRGHHLAPDPLTDPGEQDLTAHVDFTAIRAAGEVAGLRTVEFSSQAQFLTRLFQRTVGAAAVFPVWTPERLRQFKTLTHPEHLGRAFRVLVQQRD